jgi:hypothetical protein
MIDEKARLFARWIAAWAVYLFGELRKTVACFFAVYFDRIRWIEFSASVGGAAALAAQFMSFVGVPQAAKPASIATAVWTAWMYLRNPKMIRWQAAEDAPDACTE